MIAGHLQEKKDKFYIVLDYKDSKGERKTKWIATGLTVKGNRKKAEEILYDARKEFIIPGRKDPNFILFSDFMLEWLETVKLSIEATTFSSYEYEVKAAIVPYFEKTKKLLREITAKDIQDFYIEQLKRVSARTVIHYHARIHKALKHAVKMDIIPQNPADKVDRPKVEKFIGGFYNGEEINELFKIAKGTPLELAVMFGAFYGLRRSEIVGLKWDSINFKSNTLTIKHTVTVANVDGQQTIISKDRAKNKSSLRTLPLMSDFKELLLELKNEQEMNKKLCKKSYNHEYLAYIYVDKMGERIKPDYITSAFPNLLKKYGMRKIRFHDLRHSCASLLLANGVSMKQIQEWLGHSTFATTADIYSHLDFNSKISAANALTQGLKLNQAE